MLLTPAITKSAAYWRVQSGDRQFKVANRQFILLDVCTGKVHAQRNDFAVFCVLCSITTAHESELESPDKDSVHVPFHLSTNFAVLFN